MEAQEPAFDEILLGQGGEARVTLRSTPAGTAAVRRTLDSAAHTVPPQAWDHPHLLRVLGTGEDPAELLLEYAPGGSVEALLRARGALPVGEAVTLLVPVARALAHLHQAGAWHGDVSASNVLFKADGAPVLGDPGLAGELGQPGAAAGTPGWRAEGEPAGPRADVRAWGTLAWLVITGEMPGVPDARTPLPLLYPEVAPGTARLIEDCLDDNPALRPPAAELAPELLALQTALPLDAAPAASGRGRQMLLTQRPVAPRRRGPSRRAVVRWAGGAAAIGLLAVAAAAWAPSLLSEGQAGPGVQESVAGGGAGGTGSVTVQSRGERAIAAVGAVYALDRQRTAALLSGDATQLSKVYLEGEAWRSDEASLATLARKSQRYSGLGSRLVGAQLLPSEQGGHGGKGGDGGQGGEGEEVLVKATAHTSTYQVLGSDGKVVSTSPASTRELVFVLRRSEGQWRIQSIRAA